MWEYNYTINSDELYHYGIPGMKWGHRKAQILNSFNNTRNRIVNSNTYKMVKNGVTNTTKKVTNSKAYNIAKNSKVGKAAQSAGSKYYNIKRTKNNQSYAKSALKGAIREAGIKTAVKLGTLGSLAIATKTGNKGAIRAANVLGKVGKMAVTANRIATAADIGMTYVNRKEAKK